MKNMVKKEGQRSMMVLRALFNNLVIIASFILISCDHKKADSDLHEMVNLFNEINTKSVRVPKVYFTTNGSFLTSLEVVGDLEQRSVLPPINLSNFEHLYDIKFVNCVLKNTPDFDVDKYYGFVCFQNVVFGSDTSFKVRLDAEKFFILSSNLKMISFEECKIRCLNISNHKLSTMDLSMLKRLEDCVLVNNNLTSLRFRDRDDLKLKEVILYGNDFDSTTRNEIYSSIKKYSRDCTIRW